MSTLKSDAVTAITTNTDLSLSGSGTGGVKVTDYLVQTKGSDISSATSLTLGKDGNFFDVTGTTTITSIATQGIGSHVTLQFDGALTFTHNSSDLILPGAANITTAAGDIAVMYEYASADWRCVSYTKASGAAVVAGGGFTLATEQSTDIDPTSSVTFGSIPAGTTMIVMMLEGVKTGGTQDMLVRIGDSGGIETSGYLGAGGSMHATGYTESRTDGYGIILNAETHDLHNGSVILTLKDSSNFTWTATGIAGSSSNNQRTHACGGSKSLTAELTQVQFISLDVLQGGSINIMYQ